MADVQDRLREAIEAHYAYVRSRFALLVGDLSIAEDLTQEVFARFWESCLARGEPRNVGAFIGGIERIVFLGFVRTKGGQPEMVAVTPESALDPSDAPCERAEQADTSRALRGLLARLDWQDQLLIAGRHFFEMTGQELSKLSGVPRRTLIDRYNRAMEKLRLLAVQNGLGL